MDLLYSNYSNPFEFMNHYFDQGRFGEFVTKILVKENERKQKESEKEDEDKLWMLYVHSFSKKSYNDWKKSVLGNRTDSNRVTKDVNMSDNDIIGIIDRLFSKG